MSNVLCADIGTTSLKIALISEQGEVVSFCKRPLNFQKSDYVANQWLQAFTGGGAECIQKTYEEVLAICISGNGPTLVSQNGRTLLWNSILPSELKLPSTKSLFLPLLAAFKHFYKDEWKGSPHIFSGPEYLIYKLTGKAVTILPEKRFQNAYWTSKELKAFDIEEEKLPDFVEPGYFAGKTTEECNKVLGLKKAIPVFCGGPDFITALIGTGCLKAGKICDRAGSSEGLNFCSERALKSPNLRTLPSVIPGLWNISYMIPKSGSLITDFKNEISSLEERELSYEEIIDYAFNDKNSEGWRILSEILENNKKGFEEIKGLAIEAQIPFDDKVFITGGQAKNPRWLKEKAKVLGTSICRGKVFDSELLGDAIIAFTSLGLFNSWQQGAEKLVKERDLFSPEKESPESFKVFSIPEKLTTIIFDIDSTLYTSAAYAFEQVDAQIRFWAKKQNISEAQARNKISEFRRNWSSQHSGKKISLGNTFTHFGVTIEESVQMRRNLLEPKNFLHKDKRLIETIKKLKKKYKVICVTNNPELPAKKTLEALGILELIPDVIGLDTSGKSKPAREPFEIALKKTSSKAEECISIGDRYDMDISLPLEMGMGGILVSGVKDVYRLPEILSKTFQNT